MFGPNDFPEDELYYDDSLRFDEMQTAEDYNRWEEQQVFLDGEMESDYELDPSLAAQDEQDDYEEVEWADDDTYDYDDDGDPLYV